MSLPVFTTQAELFSTAGLSGGLFGPQDRYRLFALKVYPVLGQARPGLESCYCADNGRVALEPVLLLGVSLLQYLEGVPDRQAVELLRYHAGWNFALNRQLGDPVFHPTTLVGFRQRLLDHEQGALAFATVLAALMEAGLVARHSRQRLDSTQMFGRVSRMSRLDCVRESLRLALQAAGRKLAAAARPAWWAGLWDRYVDSQADYRASSETLARKLVEAGADAHQLLVWLAEQPGDLAQGEPARLLARVFGEQFELSAGGTPTPQSPEPRAVVSGAPQDPTPAPATDPAATPVVNPPTPTPAPTPISASEVQATGAVVKPKDQDQLVSDRVQNPHEPAATYAAKGQGQQKKEHVGYKVQVAETVCEVTLAPGEPTRNFITGIVTHPAYQSDEAGALLMAAEQAAMGLETPPVQYVDGAYISAQQLVEAHAAGRELIGPAPAAMQRDGRFGTEAFQIQVEARHARCPAGNASTQCSRLVEAATGKVSYRFEFGAPCQVCPQRERCVGKGQRHRTLVVGEHYSALQARRQEQETPAFKARMKHRNAIEGTQSELVRAHGLRRARYRGLARVKLQNYFIGAACNVKRWLRREVWELRSAAALLAAQTGLAPSH